MAYNENSSVSGHDEPWIQWFCGLKGHEMFCEVEQAYIEDGFNLYGLRACVPNFSDCLDLMLDRIGPDDSDDPHLTQSACTLYGLIHARYIITAHGLDAMYNKYAAKEFGTCPLVQCAGQPVLPVGVKDEVGVDTVKVFCPKCQCVYHPPPIRSRGGCCTVDGASFGTTFPHLFLMTFGNLVPDGLSLDSIYVPRVFGFRVHQSARQRNGTTASLVSTSTPNPPLQVHMKGNLRTATATETHLQQASGKDGTLPPDGVGEAVESSSRAEQIFPPASVDVGKVDEQNKSNEKDRDQEDKTPSMSNLASVKSKGASDSKTNAIGDNLMEDQSMNIVGNGNSSFTKRKSKISSGGSGSISNSQMDGKGKGNVDNGDSSLKNKSKRQRRPGNGVT